MNQLLFLCTGNYYRSRFAEEYVNYYATNQKLPIRAVSRAIQQDLSQSKNKGFLAKEVIAILDALNIPIQSKHRMPKSVSYQELKDTAQIFAMDKTEHQPMINTTFPDFNDKVRYFSVGDIHVEPLYVSAVKLVKQLDLFLVNQ